MAPLKHIFLTNSLRLVDAPISTAVSASHVTNSDAVRLFSGSSQFLTMPDAAGVSVTGDITLELWVKLRSLPAASGRMALINKWRQTATNQRSWHWIVFNNAGAQQMRLGRSSNGNQAGFVSFPLTPVTGTWQHHAITLDMSQPQATQTAGYLNGVSLGASSVVTVLEIAQIFDSTANFEVGSWDHGSQGGFLDGDVDEVRIWNVVRTQAEIAQNMYTHLSGNEAGLVGYWRLNGNLSGSIGGMHLTGSGSPTFISDTPFS